MYLKTLSVSEVNEYIKNDSRIKFYRLNNNSGAAVARNKGLDEATGRFIAFLDSDDIWDKQKLEKQINFMQTNNYGFSFTSYRLIGVNFSNPILFYRYIMQKTNGIRKKYKLYIYGNFDFL